MSSQYLNELNEEQAKAVQNYEGASLIIAGAGSGKTRVLTYRIAHMIAAGVQPYTILALTFTNKAAAEMRDRIAKVIDPEKARNIWMGTFHSVFARILRQEAEHLGFTSNFTIYDSADSQNLIKNIIKERNLNDEKYKPRAVSSRISLAKNNLMPPTTYMASAIMIAEDREAGTPHFADVYREYMMRCKANNAFDFDDLLLYTNILLRDKPEVLAKYQNKFKYILVDEYQDTNVAQYLIIKRISALHGNLSVVGDDSQSIYSFRGAKIENILRFQNDYAGCKVYKLEQNYRSTQNIVNAANCVISKNSNRLKKESFSKGPIGDKIKVYRLFTDKEEASTVASDIKMAMINDDKLTFNDFTILYRTNAQSRTFEEALRYRSIPYKIHGGFSFYQRAEIKNMLAYARIVSNNNDTEALLRIINFPTRGIGGVSMGRMVEYANENSLSLLETLSKIAKGEVAIKGLAQAKIATFMAIIDNIIVTAATKDAYATMYQIAYGAGIIKHYKLTNTVENQSALQNIEELLNSLKQVADQRAIEHMEPITMNEWLESVVLITSDVKEDESEEKVTLMTIHSAKGLEFERVFIVGMEEGLFPLEGSTTSIADIEEERRLFYVAITRAVSNLTISLCQNRYKWGRQTSCSPSRFMSEIDDIYLEMEDFEDDYKKVITQNLSNSGNFGGVSSKQAYDGSNSNSSSSFNSSSNSGFSSSSSAANRYPPKQLPPQSVNSQKHIVDTSKFKKVPPAGSALQRSTSPAVNISIGAKVEHSVFGVGVVEKLEPTSTDTKALINFDKVGVKTLLLKYAKLSTVHDE